MIQVVFVGSFPEVQSGSEPPTIGVNKARLDSNELCIQINITPGKNLVKSLDRFIIFQMDTANLKQVLREQLNKILDNN